MRTRQLIKDLLLFSGSLLYNNKASKILFYHDIYKKENYKALDADMCMGTHINVFKQHLSIIRNEGFDIVQQITKPQGQIAIMLDDGFKGIYEVKDYLIGKGIFPTIFLPAGLIGDDRLLSKNNILELQENGFRFECHSWSHVDLTTLDDKSLSKELNESKKFLEDLLGRSVTQLCLPIGYFSDHLIERAVSYGYEEIFSSVPGNYDNLIHNCLRARNLCQFSTPLELRLILRGGNELLKKKYYRAQYK